MCDICRRSPCDSRCPNAPEPKRVYVCSRCGEGVYAGDRFLREPDGDILCEICLDNMDNDELLHELGLSTEIAEEGDGYDG